MGNALSRIDRKPTTTEAVGINAVFIVLMWALELIDTILGNSLDYFGVHSWDLPMVWTLLTAPLLHIGWGHLMSNTVPFLILGILIAQSGTKNWWAVYLAGMIGSGVAAWFINAPGQITLGASGVVFAMLTYLLFRGFFSKNWLQIGLAIVIFMMYGSILWGVLPTNPAVSWQGHLGGAIGGVVAAKFLHSKPRY